MPEPIRPKRFVLLEHWHGVKTWRKPPIKRRPCCYPHIKTAIRDHVFSLVMLISSHHVCICRLHCCDLVFVHHWVKCGAYARNHVGDACSNRWCCPCFSSQFRPSIGSSNNVVYALYVPLAAELH